MVDHPPPAPGRPPAPASDGADAHRRPGRLRTHASRVASVLSALTMEGTTALLPGFLTGTLGAAPVVLGLVEAAGHGVGGLARLGGAELAAQPRRRRVVSLIGHTGVATCSALTGLAVAVWQVGALRTGAYAARGLRSPLRPAQAIEHAEPARLGRAVGVERGVDALGIALGPLLALVLLEVISVRATLVLMIVPGLLAVVVALAARRATGAHARPPLRVRTSGVTSGPLGWLLLGVAAFELSNIAVALLLLRAGKLLAAGSGPLDGAQLVALLYLLYQLAVAAAAAPAGALADRLGSGSIIAAGALALLVAYAGFAAAPPGGLLVLAGCFVLAGAAAGAVDTAEYAGVGRLAPSPVRWTAFGVLSALQSTGRMVASLTAGALWTLISPAAGLLFSAPLLLGAAVVLALRARALVRAEHVSVGTAAT